MPRGLDHRIGRTLLVVLAATVLSISLSAGIRALSGESVTLGLRADAPEPEPAQATATATIPADWQRIEPYEDTFSIALPPGWRFVERQGRDSQIGEFVGDGIRLTFDYGLYTNPLVEPGDAGYLLSNERIHCKRARVIEPLEDPARITGVYFAEVDKQGEPPFELTVGLEVHGEDLNAAQIELVLRIVRTIRFERQCAATPTPAPATGTPTGPAGSSATPVSPGAPSPTPDATSPATPSDLGAPVFLPLLSPVGPAGV